MKSLLILLFIALTTTVAAETVFDSNGDPMLNGGTYVVSPAPRVGAGKIFDAIIHHDDGTCSIAVVQEKPYSPNPVLPVNITSLARPTYITTSLPLFISFADIQTNLCTKNSDWVVTKDYVMVGDSGHPVGSLFYIKPHSSTTEKYNYKLVYCDGDDCRNIGVHVDSTHEYKRLVVTSGEPLVVQFDKVDEDKRDFDSEISMVV